MPENANHSPRLSFSQDFLHSDSIPIEQTPLRSPSSSSSHYSNFNFDFPIPVSDVLFGETSWSAGEFFLDGIILPKEIKKPRDPRDLKPRPLYPVKKKREKVETGLPKPETNPIKPVHEIEEVGDEKEIELKTINQKPDKGYFVWFDRDESLNGDIGLPLLNSKSKKRETTELQDSFSCPSSSSSSSSECSFQKLPLKKKSYGGYKYRGNGGGIKVNSILDVIPSGNLFGLSSIIVGSGSNKNKNKKRTKIFYW